MTAKKTYGAVPVIRSDLAAIKAERLDNSSLKKSLSLFDGVCITVSIMIGSGIFASPGITLERSGSPGAALVAWASSGILVSIASLCYIELGSMFPTAGGDYTYLGEAYGKGAAFCFAWYCFWISKPGSQAIVATVFGSYILTAIAGGGRDQSDAPFSASKFVAAGLHIILTTIHCFGVKQSSRIVNFFTALKVGLIIVVFTASIVFASSYPDMSRVNLSIEHSFTGSQFYSIGSAMIPCLFAFDGWADANFMMEELLDSHIVLPKLTLSAIGLVTIFYLLINVGYFCVLNQSVIENSSALALDFGKAVVAHMNMPWVGTALATGVAVCAMGAVNGSILTGGRVFYSVSRAGQSPEIFSRLNRFGAPYMAMWAQCIWCVTLILMPGSSFSSLLDYFGPVSWLIYAFTASAVIVLRQKFPEKARPFKVPLYPLPPLILVVLAVFLFVNSLSRSPGFCLLALSFVLLSVPVWWIVERHLNENSPSNLAGSSSYEIIGESF
jgi:amino acid transporter